MSLVVRHPEAWIFLGPAAEAYAVSKAGHIRIVILFLGILVSWHAFAMPVAAHWADLAVAEAQVGLTQVRITLTFPTGLTANVISTKDGPFSPGRVQAHRAALQTFFGERVWMRDGARNGVLRVEPAASIPSNLMAAPETHSTLLLIYTWTRPIQQLTLHYDLFLPGVATASCLLTIHGVGKMRTFVFTPDNREISLSWGGRAVVLWAVRLMITLGVFSGGLLIGRYVRKPGPAGEVRR